MRHKNLIDNMTTEEKAALLSGATEWETRGIKRLGIQPAFFSDGPHGIRRQVGAGDHLGLNASLPSTCFPTAAAVANSWDEALGEEIGRALGEEGAALGVDVVLGPGLNIKRSPLCGRNFEYFSEDPYLAGKMAASYIRGIQSQGVFACPKHFAVNSQELRRMAMNAVVDQRTLRELYLEGFEIAVKEGHAKSIMTSYNEINGVYANENPHLLLDILRHEWGFDGLVVTDWGGSNNHVKGVACRSNLEMPSPGLDSAREILKALEMGELTQEELDLCADDLLEALLTLSQNRENRAATQNQKATQNQEATQNQKATQNQAATQNQETTRNQAATQNQKATQNREATQNQKSQEHTHRGKGEFDKDQHHRLARRAAGESIVLLKNDKAPSPLLPLKEGCKVALIGDFARNPRYQGAGSSMVNPTRMETVEELIGSYPLELVGFETGYLREGETDEVMKKAAFSLAEQAEVVIYCFGLNELSESEGMDRNHMRIPQNQIELLEDLSKVNANVVGVLSAGGAVEMPWHHCCKAILHGFLGGQAGAGAILDTLTGKRNPSGRLSETYPIRYEDTPSFRNFPSIERNCEYRESLFVGYRYYDTSKVRVLFPFGFGLSYTEFEYSDLKVAEDGIQVRISNTGDREGAEVVQLYVSAPKEHIFCPDKELKGFSKVWLKAGESKTVKIPFDDKTFRYWNSKTNHWETEGGEYILRVGANVMDIRLSQSITIKGTTQEYPYDKESLKSYFSGLIQNVSDKEFETLLGTPIPDGSWSGELRKNDAICQLYYAKSALARLIYKILTHLKKKSEKKGKPDLNILFIYNMPFRGIAKMTHGAVSMEMVDGMVEAVNGHLLSGLKKIIGGHFKNRRLNKTYEKKL